MTLYQIGKETGITAHVSDTYNFFQAVDNLVALMAFKSTSGYWPTTGNDKNVLVLRPDSGDPAECVLHILKTCEKYGVFAESDGLKISTRIRWIQGDSMDWDSMIAILDMCLDNGWSPFGSGAFGVGGHLRNSIARDHTGLSMKLAEVGVNARPTVKRSETLAKCSIPGEVVVIDNNKDNCATVYPAHHRNTNFSAHTLNLLVPYYDGRRATTLAEAFKPAALVSPAEIKARIASDFMRRLSPDQVLSDEIFNQRTALLSGNNW